MNPMYLSPIDKLAYCTVRLECDFQNGKTGSGTGFYFRFAHTGDISAVAIVTNRHVIEGASIGRFFVNTCNTDGVPEIGNQMLIEIGNFESLWIKHSSPNVDLCAFPIAHIIMELEKQNKNIFYQMFTIDDIATDDNLQDLHQIENIIMIGYPIGLWDSKNNMPIFRRGITATHPALDWEGKSEFLIDAACFPGSSGSPVLLFDIGFHFDKKCFPRFGNIRRKLLGILYAGPMYSAEGEIKITQIPTSNIPFAITEIPTHLGIAIKAKELFNIESQIRKAVELGIKTIREVKSFQKNQNT